MECPNCKKLFIKERDGKFQCEDCGWFEKVGQEWRSCQEPEPKPEPQGPQPPEPPGPQPPEPVGLQPPEPNVKKYLGGLITITEVDE